MKMLKQLFNDVNDHSNSKQRPLKLLTTTVGIITPLSILLSIPFIESSWMLNNVFENKEFKLHPINAICSIIANLFQLFGSITLVTRFWGKKIVLNTILSIVFFFIHFVLMTISIVFYYLNSEIKHKEVSYKFILSSVATCLSLVSVLFLTFDFIKYKTTSKNKIISKKHRMLVIYCMLTIIWSKIGAIIFCGLEGWSFIDGIYFTLVTNTTMGFGDLTPKLLSTKIFLFFYAIIGITFTALLINSVRIALLKSVESMFLKNMKRIENHDSKINYKNIQQFLSSSFDYKNANYIRYEYHNNLLNEKWYIIKHQLMFSILALALFWFIGGVVFMYAETWTYFDGIYFCFVSFTTIGYGDFVPKEVYGRGIMIFYSLLGLVTAAYVISVCMDVSVFLLDKRINDDKYKMEVSESNNDGLNEEIKELLSKFQKDNIKDKDEVLLNLITLSKMYQKMVGILLADQDGLLSKELLEKKEFTNLEQFHLFFCIILNKYIHELSNGNDNNNNTNEMKENVINNYNLQFYNHKIIDRLKNAFVNKDKVKEDIDDN